MQPTLVLTQSFAIGLALVRGLGELAMLQRWRLREWLLRARR